MINAPHTPAPISAIALTLCVTLSLAGAGPAMAGQKSGTEKLQGAPAVVDNAKAAVADSAKGAGSGADPNGDAKTDTATPAEPSEPTLPVAGPADLRHRIVSGAWTGMVEEVGAEPYRMMLELRDDATGAVSYEGYDCSGVLASIAGGPQLRYREVITTGRDVCADGEVVLSMRGAVMLWTWYNADGDAQAAATLRRVVADAPEIVVPEPADVPAEAPAAEPATPLPVPVAPLPAPTQPLPAPAEAPSDQ